jgi:hypothetical protein
VLKCKKGVYTENLTLPVTMLEAEVSRLREGQNYFAVPGLPPGMKNAPPGWKKFDYYGQTIYLVPLDSPFPSERKK